MPLTVSTNQCSVIYDSNSIFPQLFQSPVNTWAVYEQSWKQMKKDDLAETSVVISSRLCSRTPADFQLSAWIWLQIAKMQFLFCSVISRNLCPARTSQYYRQCCQVIFTLHPPEMEIPPTFLEVYRHVVLSKISTGPVQKLDATSKMFVLVEDFVLKFFVQFRNCLILYTAIFPLQLHKFRGGPPFCV